MERSELTQKTVKELRVDAEKLGVKRISALKKEELIEAIIAADADVNPSAAKSAAEKDSKVAADKKSAEKAEKDEIESAAKDDKKSAAKDDKKSASAKAGAADDEDDEADADEVEELDENGKIVVKSKKGAKKDDKDDEKVKEPAPVEPGSVFIDHGAILPEYVPGTCLFALVRDPGTIFVYWNADIESDNGWLLTAYDYNNNILQQFSTPVRRNGRGYFRVPSSSVARVTLAKIQPSGAPEVKLESRVRIAEQLGLTQQRQYDERWIDVSNGAVVYEAPAPGYAPQAPDYAQRMIAPAITGGGYDRSVESQDHPFGCSMSSRFGSLGAPGAPGSSDLLISSDRLVRRH